MYTCSATARLLSVPPTSLQTRGSEASSPAPLRPFVRELLRLWSWCLLCRECTVEEKPRLLRDSYRFLSECEEFICAGGMRRSRGNGTLASPPAGLAASR